MDRKQALIAFIFLVWLSPLQAQKYQAGFVKPVDLPFNLAGSFGEPRPDHFHSGIDIKTNETEGYPVFAIGDGYISRIRVSPYGYGKSVYITHPNGYTSVYGHLSGFNEAIENYVHQQHYQIKRSELDLFPAASQFRVKQNDTIAFSGNTGGSSGPHLHFEIRDSQTEHALNPLDFYPKEFYVDEVAPQLNKVKIYQFNDAFYNAYTTIGKLVKRDDDYTSKPIILSNDSLFCISLEGYDKQDSSENKNGICRMEVSVNGLTVFSYYLDEINFDQTRMCNAFIDYDEMMNGNGYFYNGYQLANNTLPVYSPGKKGMIRIENNDTLHINIACYDYNKNAAHVSLTVIRKDGEPPKDTLLPEMGPLAPNKILFNKADSLRLGKMNLYIPANTFYDNQLLTLTELNSEMYAVTSNFIVPLQKAVKIEINSAIHKKRDKVIIVRQDEQAGKIALKTNSDKNKFYADTKELGTFWLAYDTIGPVIELSGIKEDNIKANISDELSGIQSYHGYIDGNWVNFYYDAKNDLVTYRYDEYCPPGEHNLKLVVTDAVGNSTIFTQTFKR